jgi:hypothetical protein
MSHLEAGRLEIHPDLVIELRPASAGQWASVVIRRPQTEAQGYGAAVPILLHEIRPLIEALSEAAGVLVEMMVKKPYEAPALTFEAELRLEPRDQVGDAQ